MSTQTRLHTCALIKEVTLMGGPFKLVDKYTYLGSSVSSTKKDIYTWLAKEWIVINRLSVICKSDLTDKIKRSFFQAVIVSIRLYGCTTWMLIKHIEKRLHGDYKRMLRASPGGNTLQNSSCTATYHSSRKISKLDEPEMRDTAGEVRTNS